jgi:hypothetical protein
LRRTVDSTADEGAISLTRGFVRDSKWLASSEDKWQADSLHLQRLHNLHSARRAIISKYGTINVLVISQNGGFDDDSGSISA